jgi:hypothetical protein
MPRLQHLICSGFCLINIAAFSQGLPKHPTSQQIAGYQLHQQQQWINNQQPKNSVLYQNNSNAGSLQFTFGKKEKSMPVFQTPAGYLPQAAHLKQIGQTTTVREKIPPVGQFNAWKNFSKWKHLFDGGSHLGLIGF